MKKSSKKTLPPVTVEEAPYTLPEGWKWVRLGELCTLFRGVSYKKQDAHTIAKKNDCLILRGGNIKEGIITFADDDVYVDKSLVNADQYLHKNDVVIVASTGSLKVIGRAGTSKQDYSNVAFGAFLLIARANDFVYAPYFSLFFQSMQYREKIRSLVSGVNINNIRAAYITNMEFPLPEIDTQIGLVDTVNALFSKLDEAEEKIDQALAAFPARRAALLHRAFQGDLTKEWRKEHGVGMETWSNKNLASMCHSLKYGTAKKSEKQGKVAVLRMGNLQNGEIDWENLVYTEDADDIAKYQLFPGDVLFNRTNSPELVGKTSIYRGERPAIYAGYLIKLDYDRNVLIGDFLNYVLNSPDAKAYCMHVKSDGVSQSNINAKKIGAYEIPVPSLPEQQEIVRLLGGLLAKEDKAKALAASMKENIARLRAAILARAFRGAL